MFQCGEITLKVSSQVFNEDHATSDLFKFSIGVKREL